MKKSILKILAITMILCLTIPFVACIVEQPANESDDGYAYVAIDINPSLELIVKDGVVIKVRALNDDANVLLSGEEIEGLPVEKATEIIVSVAQDLGYINEENTDVRICVTSAGDKTTARIEQKAENAVTRGSKIAIAVRNERSEDIARVKELKEENPELYAKLTPAVHRIIEQILKLNPELTYEELAKKSVPELIELLAKLAKEKDETASEEVKEEMKERYEELKKEARRRVAEIYGEEYLEKHNRQEAIEEIFEKIKGRFEFTEEDKNAILALLGVESVDQICENGRLTVEAIDAYIKEKLEGALSEEKLNELKARLQEIYDKYKNKYEDRLLTEEEREEIKNEFGEYVDVDRVSEFEDFIENKKQELEEKREQIQLDDKKKEQLNEIKEEMSGYGERVKEEFKEKIESSKDRFDKIKEQKLEEWKNNFQNDSSQVTDTESTENDTENNDNSQITDTENSEGNKEPSGAEDEKDYNEDNNPIKDWLDKIFGGR